MALVLAFSAAKIPSGPARPAGEGEVRELIARWNKAYLALDARGLASLQTDDFEVVDRLGHWISSEGREWNERFWKVTFQDIQKGRPGPEKKIERVRMLTPDVAVVQATSDWGEVVLEDGTRIAPHGEIDTFVVVKKQGRWLVAALNVHNEAPGTAP
jgi:uncharacterized protein (TIGR02246 family)